MSVSIKSSVNYHSQLFYVTNDVAWCLFKIDEIYTVTNEYREVGFEKPSSLKMLEYVKVIVLGKKR